MKKNNLKPKKFFGQNFLSDFQLIEELIEEINIQQIDHLLEIGPGKGAMTSLLLEKCESLTAIEIDKDLIRFLKKAYGDRKNFNLIEKDILLYDPKELVRVNKLIGNIPYNISTPIIEWIIDNKSSFDEIFLMLQKEFGERCVAQPNTKSYGRLSIFVQCFFDVTVIREVDKSSFTPSPKVQSIFLKLIPKVSDKTPNSILMKNLSILTREAFSKRRKLITNSLKSFFTEEDLVNLGIERKSRPENLSVETYIKLAKSIQSG